MFIQYKLKKGYSHFPILLSTYPILFFRRVWYKRRLFAMRNGSRTQSWFSFTGIEKLGARRFEWGKSSNSVSEIPRISSSLSLEQKARSLCPL
jgi:hypothetical protein